MHFIRVHDDFGFVVIGTQRLHHFCAICNTVARKHCALHGHKPAAVINSVIRVFIKMRQIIKKFFQALPHFCFWHVVNHHCKIVIVAACACIDKIRAVHGRNNARQHLVRRYVPVDFVDDSEFLYVKMDECVILNAFVHRHFKAGNQPVPVVVPGDGIKKCLAVQVFFVKLVDIIVDNGAGAIGIKLPFIQNPYFLIGNEGCHHFRIFFYGQIAVSPVRIIISCNARKNSPDRIPADFRIIVNLD